jgi:hypothetical protein
MLSQRGLALGLGAHQKQVQHAHAQIEAVEHHVAHDHHGNQPEPDESHHETPGSFFQPVNK